MVDPPSHAGDRTCKISLNGIIPLGLDRLEPLDSSGAFPLSWRNGGSSISSSERRLCTAREAYGSEVFFFGQGPNDGIRVTQAQGIIRCMHRIWTQLADRKQPERAWEAKTVWGAQAFRAGCCIRIARLNSSISPITSPARPNLLGEAGWTGGGKGASSGNESKSQIKSQSWSNVRCL